MKCKKCRYDNPKEEDFCISCGASLIGKSMTRDGEICCPKCGSTKIHFITIEKEDGFDEQAACCGYLVGGIFGALAAGSRQNKRRSGTTRKCTDCGHVF